MLDFIINPIAGDRSGKKMLKKMNFVESYLTKLNIPYKFNIVMKEEDSKTTTSELIKNGATDIIVMGGDGTLHNILNGITNFEQVNLGLIPCGTGNDFAKNANIPTDIKSALQLILDKKICYTDYIELPNVRCINVVGFGLDVQVLEEYAKLKKKSKFGYFKCLLKTLFNLKDFNTTAVIDGKEYTFNSLITCVANGSYFGGGLTICPIAKSNDNVLHFVNVGKIKGFKVLGALIKLVRGKILTHKQTTLIDAENVFVKPANSNNEQASTLIDVIQVDGELYKNVNFDLKVVKNKLKMYRP